MGELVRDLIGVYFPIGFLLTHCRLTSSNSL